MMLDPLGISSCRLALDPERPQEGLDQSVPGMAAIREIVADPREKHASIWPLRNEPFVDRRLSILATVG